MDSSGASVQVVMLAGCCQVGYVRPLMVVMLGLPHPADGCCLGGRFTGGWVYECSPFLLGVSHGRVHWVGGQSCFCCGVVFTVYDEGMDDMWYWVAVVAAAVGVVSVVLGFVAGFLSGQFQTPLIIGLMGGLLAWAGSLSVLLARWLGTGVALFETEHVELAATVWSVASICLLVMVPAAGAGTGLMMWSERFDGRAARGWLVAGGVLTVVAHLAGLVLLGGFVVEWVVSGSLF